MASKLSNKNTNSVQFELERRKSFNFSLEFKYNGNAPVDLTGCTTTLTVKTAEFDNDDFDTNNIIITNHGDMPDPTNGVVNFDLQAGELDVNPDTYYLNVTLRSPEGYSVNVCSGTMTIVPNTESDSMHYEYGGMNPMASVDVFMKDIRNVISVSTGYNMPVFNIKRPPGTFITDKFIANEYDEETIIAISDINYGDEEPRIGDMVWQKSMHGIAAIVQSFDNTNVVLITKIIAYRSELQSDWRQDDDSQIDHIKNRDIVMNWIDILTEVFGPYDNPDSINKWRQFLVDFTHLQELIYNDYNSIEDWYNAVQNNIETVNNYFDNNPDVETLLTWLREAYSRSDNGTQKLAIGNMNYRHDAQGKYVRCNDANNTFDVLVS